MTALAPHFTGRGVTLYHGDCLEVMRTLPDASVDAVVTDPPYGLEFMGKGWDAPWEQADVNADAGFHGGGISATKSLPSFTGTTNPKCLVCKGTRRGRRDGTAKVAVCLCEDGGVFPNTRAVEMRAFQDWCEAWATECLRVLKPGGHLLAFGGSRTWHRLACAVEDAGFEIRDSIAWLYGSGFPKSLDVSKAIDKARDDRDDVLQVTSTLAALADAAGITRADIDAHMGTSDMGGWWLSNLRHRCACPSVENWTRLRDFIPGATALDDLVWRLNGRKGSPGEAWDKREVVGSAVGYKAHYGGVTPLSREYDITAPATPDAERWQGWGTALKPSHEPVVVARKPHVIGGILEGIGSELARLEGECRPSANGAARSSAPTPAASPEARAATAPASAATQHEDGQEPTTPTGAAVATSDQTATSWSDETTAPTPWSTVSSWRACWAELCELTSTSTTSTTTEATTDLRTLWSSISSLTVTSTPGSPTPALTSGSTASAVDSLFAATVLRLRATLALSATESATASTPHVPQAAGGSSAFEPIVVARKPLAGTVAANVLAHGTGALNIDGCRVEGEPRTTHADGNKRTRNDGPTMREGFGIKSEPTPAPSGRWPTNVLIDDSQAAELDRQSGTSVSRVGKPRGAANGDGWGMTATGAEYDDQGGASRFFPTFRYEAKAPTSERPRAGAVAHPTVKPLDLMRWLVRLVTPPGGTVLEPFAGSGTTAEACVLEGFECIAIEREADYLPLITNRLNRRTAPVEFLRATGADMGLFEELEEGAL